jgi:hypothetical protein
MQSTMSVREESDKTLYETTMHALQDNDHFIKNCKLLSAVQSCIINVAAETVKKTTEEKKTQKKSF